jgi:hypothetical protein
MLKKVFITWATVANFIELFWHNLHPFWHIVLSFDSDFAARGVNYAQKTFMKLTPGKKQVKLTLDMIGTLPF